jgi:hypothetical protein
METQYSDMVEKAKEIRRAFELQQQSAGSIVQKAETLASACNAAEMKLLPAKLKISQIVQTAEIANGVDMAISSPKIEKTGIKKAMKKIF